MISIVSTIEINPILESLENSIDLHFCLVTDCVQQDETYSYYALMITNSIPIDFNKNDFINFITDLDNISNEDLAILTENITLVYKAFPSSQSDFLIRVVVINATIDIYSILDDLINSIESHECNSDDVILGITESKDIKKSTVYPNPITENSIIKLNINSSNIRWELINSLGQIIHQENISGKNLIELKELSIVNGIYFIKIYNLTNGTTEVLKIIKAE